MFRRIAYAAGLLLIAHINNAVASEELPEFLVVFPQAEMEKCFGLADAKPQECATDPDSEDCKTSEKKAKDGTEFKYVPIGSCGKQGGTLMMTTHPKPQK